MAGLQRSSGTFRRLGSSGLVWEWDDKHLSGEIRPAAAAARRGADLDGGGAARAPEAAAAVRVERSRSSVHKNAPPSPRVALCGGGFCGFFRGDGEKKKKKRNDARKARRR